MGYFVEVSENIETSGLYHFERLSEIGIDNIAYVAVEIPLHIVAETLEIAVYVYQRTVLCGDEMHRADTIVQPEVAEIAVRRTPHRAQIVDFHTGIEVHTVAVAAARLGHVGQISVDIGLRHIAA